jgi:tripartite-type tricarboxylate transporter receptor subunit TctC
MKYALALGACLLSSVSPGQDYPARPVTVVIPFSIDP